MADFQNSSAVILSFKFVKAVSIPPHLKYEATLPCQILL